MQQTILQEQQHQTKRFNQRDRIDILAQILQMLSTQKRKEKSRYNKNTNYRSSRAGDVISFTSIKLLIGLSTKQLKRYIVELCGNGFIVIDVFQGRNRGQATKRKTTNVTWKIPRLTEKGIIFLQVYRGMRDLII